MPFWTAAPWSRKSSPRRTSSNWPVKPVPACTSATSAIPAWPNSSAGHRPMVWPCFTGETCPPLPRFYRRETPLSCGTVFKCAPPLRTAEARDGLWEYVLDGTLSCIGSDHSPSRPDEKDEAVHGVMGAWGGLSGLESLGAGPGRNQARDPARVQPEPAGPVRAPPPRGCSASTAARARSASGSTRTPS